MPRPSAYLALTMMLLGLLACGSDDAPPLDGSAFGDALDEEGRAALRSELAEARSRWSRAGVSAYLLDVEHWTLGMETGYRLRVEEDSIHSAVRVPEDGEPYALIPRDSLLFGMSEDSPFFGMSEDSLHSVLRSRLPTVSYLFRTVEAAIDSALVLRVEFDPELGYPRSLVVDHSTNFDDEVSYTVRELEPLQSR